MKLIMLVISVLLTGLTGCYSKRLKFIEQDLMIISERVATLKVEMDFEFNKQANNSQNKIHSYAVEVLELNDRVLFLEKFKSAHDARWPNLVPKKKK